MQTAASQYHNRRGNFSFQQMICRPAAAAEKGGRPNLNQEPEREAPKKERCISCHACNWSSRGLSFSSNGRGARAHHDNATRPFRFPAQRVCLLVACSPCRATAHSSCVLSNPTPGKRRKWLSGYVSSTFSKWNGRTTICAAETSKVVQYRSTTNYSIRNRHGKKIIHE